MSSNLKVGDRVNALVYPGDEILGTIEQIKDHQCLILPDNLNRNKCWTFLVLVYKLKDQV
jgi:hypothetical protein